MAETARGGQVPGVIMHTDRGRIHRDPGPAGLRPPFHLSVNGPAGSVMDDAVIESWRLAAQARVSAWIEDYNQGRRHSALAMMSPLDYGLFSLGFPHWFSPAPGAGQ